MGGDQAPKRGGFSRGVIIAGGEKFVLAMIPFLIGSNSFGGAITTPWEQLLGVTIAPRNDYYSLGFDPPNGTTNPERGAATGAPQARFQNLTPSIGATKIR